MTYIRGLYHIDKAQLQEYINDSICPVENTLYYNSPGTSSEYFNSNFNIGISIVNDLQLI